MAVASQEFWNNVFSNGKGHNCPQVKPPDLNDPILRRALVYFGDIQNKTLIDLGSGRGTASLFFAYYGANVISVDLSEVAINNLTEYCNNNNINSIKPIKLEALDISTLGKVDIVFGSMILHHIEQFYKFVVCLRDVIKPKGKGFFFENNAGSSLMMWFRKNIVGKLWIPKFGDPDEYPLMPEEINELRKYFNVEVEFPELLYFRMIPNYIFRGHFKRPFELLDKYFYRYSSFRDKSYRQCLYIS